MGTTYRYIADPSEASTVIEWFRALADPPTELPWEQGTLLHFPKCGPLVQTADGKVDSKSSPLVSVYHPQVKRGVLWTVGEVHFLSMPLQTQFPKLQKINSAFHKWLSGFECVFSNKRQTNEYDYYLEGSIKNCDPAVYAFESGLRALTAGRYFIGNDDSDARLDVVCRSLALRGINCTA